MCVVDEAKKITASADCKIEIFNRCDGPAGTKIPRFSTRKIFYAQ